LFTSTCVYKVYYTLMLLITIARMIYLFCRKNQRQAGWPRVVSP